VTRFLFKRLWHAFFSLIAVTLAVYIMLNASGDPATMMLPDTATPEDVAELRRVLGLDAPLYQRYFRFLGNALRGDLGTSFTYLEPTIDIVLAHVPATAELALAGMAVALLISIPLGVLASLFQGRALDKIALSISLLGQSIPVFWLGMMAIMFFSVWLGWLPTSGYGGFKHLLLPALTLGWFANALITRLVRSCMLEVLGQDFITTARSKGIAETFVVLKHAFRNAAIPVVTVAGLQLGSMMGGTVVTEIVFAWPGVARLTLESIFNRDFPLALTAILFIAFVFIAVNFLVDLTYTIIDPRVRLEQRTE
jgi:ABC-type dipeptide/oligopeptide/nickel transport system permease component